MNQNLPFSLFIVLLSTCSLLSQSTKELYTVSGLTFYNEVIDDTGCITPSRFTYTKDTIIQDKLASEFDGFSVYGQDTYYLHFDDQEVYTFHKGNPSSPPQI